MLIALLAVCLLLAASSQSSTNTSTVPVEGFIEIDGSKNPEKIPTWHMWQSGFSFLAFAERQQSIAVPASLQMGDADKELVFAAARQHELRVAACQKRVEELRPLLGKIEDSEINVRTEAIQLECRQATLDAADMLMEALSPESQTSLLAWLEARKASMKVFVPEAELDHYHRPY